MTYDLCAIGNALVDIIVSTDDRFLQANAITKGSMSLIDDALAATLYERSGSQGIHASGGSAANSLAGFASLGGRGAFLGKIGADPFGKIFSNDLHSQNVYFACPPAPDMPTGRCLIFVTPDAQRSMNTCLGAASEFGPDDLDPSLIRNSAVTYLEGYLFDKNLAKEAFYNAAHIVHQSRRKLALTLSDTFCVERHRDTFLDLIKNSVNILFANEAELLALYQTQNLPAAINCVRTHVDIAVITRGAQGALVADAEHLHEITAYPTEHIVDTTGAGDLFAAGFLFGLSRDKSLAEAGWLGARAAAEVISHFGPRPHTSLAKLMED